MRTLVDTEETDTDRRATTTERSSEHVRMAATYQVSQPEPFDFSNPEEWPKWLRRFERFRQASGLTEKLEKVQVNTLIYCMGDAADDILRSFKLTEANLKVYETVKEKFESHFVKRRNVIFERAKFNNRKPEQGEPVDSFITALYTLAEHCNYGALYDEMIRDRIVVGLRNLSLSEKLQLDAGLTLATAVTKVRQAEAVKKQQPLLRGETLATAGRKLDLPVGAVTPSPKPQPTTSLGVTVSQAPAPGVGSLLMTVSPALPEIQFVANAPSGDTSKPWPCVVRQPEWERSIKWIHQKLFWEG